jgi:hypothetical protein
MKFSRICDSLRLIGQGGIIRTTSTGTDIIKYGLNDSDQYIRAEIGMKDLTKLYLNPLFRFDGTISRIQPEIDIMKTWIFRSACIILISLSAIIYVNRKRKKSISRA